MERSPKPCRWSGWSRLCRTCGSARLEGGVGVRREGKGRGLVFPHDAFDPPALAVEIEAELVDPASKWRFARSVPALVGAGRRLDVAPAVDVGEDAPLV